MLFHGTGSNLRTHSNSFLKQISQFIVLRTMIDLYLDMNLIHDLSFQRAESTSPVAVSATSERIIFNSHFLRLCYEKYSKKDNISDLRAFIRAEGIRTNGRISFCCQDFPDRAV